MMRKYVGAASFLACAWVLGCGDTGSAESPGGGLGAGGNLGTGGSPGPTGGNGGTTGGGAMFVADEDGYVVMEMESVAIPSGHEWDAETALSEFTGSSYYRFTGNGICSGPAGSPLRYEFEIGEAARYELRLRAAKIAHCVAGQALGNGNCSEDDRTCTSLGEPVNGSCGSPDECIRTDISNDAFVHIEDAGGAYVAFVDQPGGSLGNPIKLFGGQANAWSWTGKSALDTNGKKWDAHWDLGAGRYTLVIQGRSQSFRIDRILFFDADTGSTSGAVDRPETR